MSFFTPEIGSLREIAIASGGDLHQPTSRGQAVRGRWEGEKGLLMIALYGEPLSRRDSSVLFDSLTRKKSVQNLTTEAPGTFDDMFWV